MVFTRNQQTGLPGSELADERGQSVAPEGGGRPRGRMTSCQNGGLACQMAGACAARSLAGPALRRFPASSYTCRICSAVARTPHDYFLSRKEFLGPRACNGSGRRTPFLPQVSGGCLWCCCRLHVITKPPAAGGSSSADAGHGKEKAAAATHLPSAGRRGAGCGPGAEASYAV